MTSDVITLIRDRLAGCSPPEPWARKTGPLTCTPEEAAAWDKALRELIAGRLVVTLYPGYELMRATILALIERHEPVHYDGQTEYGYRDEPVFSADGTPRGTVRVQGEPLPPDWCDPCGMTSPCEELLEIASNLGITLDETRPGGADNTRAHTEASDRAPQVHGKEDES